MQVSINLYTRETEGSTRVPMTSSYLSAAYLISHTQTTNPAHTLVNGLLSLEADFGDTLHLVFTLPYGSITQDLLIRSASLGELTLDTQTATLDYIFDPTGTPDIIYSADSPERQSTDWPVIIPTNQF